MKKTVAVAGLGQRGYRIYATLFHKLPERVQIVAVADTDADKVAEARETLGIDENNCFSSAEELLEQPKLADALVIATLDQQHVPQAIKALEKGYDLLLEKPISGDKKECQEILEVAERLNRKVVVCHVLRYSPFYRKVKEVLDSKVLGELMNIQAIENVGYWHYAHSFIRGNWRNSEETTPMIMQKCCHDMDLMVWLTGRKCEKVSSFGDLGYFHKKNAPEGATAYCMGGCKAKKSCPYDAEEFYINHPTQGVANGNTSWPVNMIEQYPTVENVRAALPNHQYGRCVFHCDNNVVDHQVVNLEMEGGLTVNFTMTAFTEEISRYSKYMGTHGQMIADMKTNIIEVERFGYPKEIIDLGGMEGHVGHGGGDEVIVSDFLDYLNGKECTGITSIRDSLESHFICMAAEESRVNGGKVISLQEFRKQSVSEGRE